MSNNNAEIPKPSQILNSNPTTSTNNRKKSDQIKPNSSSKTTTGTSKDIVSEKTFQKNTHHKKEQINYRRHDDFNGRP